MAAAPLPDPPAGSGSSRPRASLGWPGGPSFPVLQHSLCALAARGSMLAARGLGIVLISRQLGAERLGVYALLLATYNIALSLGAFGVEQTYVYEAGRRPRRAASLAGNGLVVAALFGGSASALFLATVALLGGRIFTDAPVAAVALSAAALPMGVLHNALAGVVVGLGRFRWYGVLETVKWTAYGGVVAALYAAGKLDVASALACFYAVVALGAAAHLVALARIAGRPRPSRRLLGHTLRLGRSMLAVQLGHVLALRLDVYAVRTFGSAALVGRYALASQLSEIVLYVARPFALVIFSGAARGGSPKALRMRLMGWILVGLVGILAGALLVAGDALLPPLFGDASQGCRALLLLRLPGILTFAFFLVLGGELLGRGEAGRLLRGNVAGLVALVALAWPLTLWRPGPGTALAFTLASALQLAWVVPAWRAANPGRPGRPAAAPVPPRGASGRVAVSGIAPAVASDGAVSLVVPSAE